MSKKLVIYGAGGLGREVRAMLYAMPEWEVVGFYDDNKTKDTVIDGLPILGGIDEALTVNETQYFVLGIGDPAVKQSIAQQLMSNKFLIPAVLIHPSAIIYDRPNVIIGDGCLVGAGVILTTRIVLGEHVLLNLNCTVGHDVKIGGYSSVMPGVNIAGEVRVGEAVMIGAGANVLNGLYLGDNSQVGAGAVVTKDVTSAETVVGVPAKALIYKS